MRAAVARRGDGARGAGSSGSVIDVAELADPTPGSGHVLVRSLACGICGSDLHAADDLDHFVELSSRAGMPSALDLDQGLVFGHEFCAEIVDHGPDTAGSLPVGTRVCCVPTILGPTGPEAIGYSNQFPGGLAELMVLQEVLLLPVPDGLATEAAALTEPLAVGEHAVTVADLRGGEVCLVVGCGPVGLAVISALKARGVGPVLTADFSPTRRRLAELVGADEAIDPAASSPYTRWADFGVAGDLMERAVREMFGASFTEAVIFEAVGAPGVLQTIIDGAPPRARLVVVGVCMQTDHIEPFDAVVKQLELRFAFAYTPAEFAATLDRLATGVPGMEALVTDVVGLDGVAAAFTALRRPDEHGKVLVRHES